MFNVCHCFFPEASILPVYNILFYLLISLLRQGFLVRRVWKVVDLNPGYRDDSILC